MLRLFLDVSDLRVLFQSTEDENTKQSNFLTRTDFKVWLMEAVNWTNLCHVDFDLSYQVEGKIKDSVLKYKGMEEIYALLKDALAIPEIEGKTIFSCFGLIDGDILYLLMDVGETCEV